MRTTCSDGGRLILSTRSGDVFQLATSGPARANLTWGVPIDKVAFAKGSGPKFIFVVYELSMVSPDGRRIVSGPANEVGRVATEVAARGCSRPTEIEALKRQVPCGLDVVVYEKQPTRKDEDDFAIDYVTQYVAVSGPPYGASYKVPTTLVYRHHEPLPLPPPAQCPPMPVEVRTVQPVTVEVRDTCGNLISTRVEYRPVNR